MASLSAKEAAAQVGMTKAGLLKAVRNGKVSATKDANGEWQIDAAELFRVYAPVNQNIGDKFPKVDDSTQGRTQAFIAEIEGLRSLVDALKSERDDLREQRRQLMAVLTDQRQREEVQEVRRSIWSKLLGR